MFLITAKEDNRILNMGKFLDYLNNGYPRLVEEDTAFPAEDVNVYEVQELPDYVEVEKYCYDKKGFYKNENYVEPEREQFQEFNE